jgi:hypothetical protein
MDTFLCAGQEKLTFPRKRNNTPFGEMSLCEVISLPISMLEQMRIQIANATLRRSPVSRT